MAKEWPTFASPASVNGERLNGELRAAGFLDPTAAVVGGRVRVVARRGDGDEIDESDRPAIEAVIAAHTGTATAQQQQQQTDTTTLRDALASGTVPEYVKAAIRRLGIRP